jgi:hypothetical protein
VAFLLLSLVLRLGPRVVALLRLNSPACRAAIVIVAAAFQGPELQRPFGMLSSRLSNEGAHVVRISESSRPHSPT